MRLLVLVVWILVAVAVTCVLGAKYIKAWLEKRRRLERLKRNLGALRKRKEDLISLYTWAYESGDKKEGELIQSDLESVKQDIEQLQDLIQSVQSTSIFHPGYESLSSVF